MVAVIASACLAKTEAVVLGPGGMASLALLLTLVNVTAVPASLGVTQAMIRRQAAGGCDALALRRAAALLRVLGAAVVIVPLLVFARFIADSAFAGKVSTLEVDGAIGVLALNLVFLSDTGLLTARHRVSRLVVVTVVDSIVASLAMGALLVAFGRTAIAPALLVAAAVGVVTSRLAVRRLDDDSGSARVSPASEVRHLARDGVPYTIAMVVGTAASLAIPALAVHLVHDDDIAYYQASVTVATAYLGFVVVVMGQDYLPRLVAASREEVGHLVDIQVRLLLTVAMPIILATYALAPTVVRVAFSSSFLPAVDVLRWQLIADVLRFVAWSLSFVILARMSMGRFAMVELVGGVSLVTSVILCSGAWGLAGLGIAWVTTYAIYLAVCAFVAARAFGLQAAPQTRRLLEAAALTLAALIVLNVFGGDGLRLVVAAALCAGWCGHGIKVLSPNLRSRRAGELEVAPAAAAQAAT